MGVAALCLLAAASTVQALTYDARRLGMASVQTPGSRELMSRNVAYQSMPARRHGAGVVVPLPLGLAQLATNFPTLDPEDPDFSVTRLANTALNPPFFLELRSPPDLDGDISVFVARNEFSIDFEDAQDLLPRSPIEMGSVWAPPLASLRVERLRAYTGPFVFTEGNVTFDEAFHDVLTQGAPLLPNSEYVVQAGGESAMGMTMAFGISSPLVRGRPGDGLYAGAYVKYMLGFGMALGGSRFTMATGDTIFGSGDPLDVGYEAEYRYATLGTVGNGIGVDAGIGYRHGALDFGFGLRDIGSHIFWGKTTLERARVDALTNQVETSVVEYGQPYTQRLPLQATLNAAWSGYHTTLAGDVTTSRFGTELHLGAERLVGPIALRSGLRTDTQARLQYAGGVGLGFSRVWLDVGLSSHNQTFTSQRGLTLGTSLSLR